MGQYWKVVNLTKREFIHPHRLGSGLKLWEIIANEPVGQALLILTAAMPEARGGGDLDSTHVDGEKVVGRWAGDRIAIVGDYAEDDDLSNDYGDPPASVIYSLCSEEKYLKEDSEFAKLVKKHGGKVWRDVSPWVRQIMADALDRRFYSTSSDDEGVVTYVDDGKAPPDFAKNLIAAPTPNCAGD